MEKELRNIVGVTGNYSNVPTSITSAASVVTVVNGLSITKTADKNIWADGVLTYTIVVTNDADKTYETPTITDVLDTNLIDFVEGSVTIDGVSATSSNHNYNSATSTLTVNLEDITVSSSKTVKFRVKMKNV